MRAAVHRNCPTARPLLDQERDKEAVMEKEKTQRNCGYVLDCLHLLFALPQLFIMITFIIPALFIRLVSCAFGIAPRLPSTDNDMYTPTILFDGGGWAAVFSLGVVDYLLTNYVLPETTRAYAISSGNLAALCLMLQLDPNELVQERFPSLIDAMRARPVDGLCGQLQPLRQFLESILPDDAHQRLSNRLVVIVSNWPFLGFRGISTFVSRLELIDSIIASCSLPGFVAFPFCNCSKHAKWRGCWFDAATQNILTPLDDLVDLAIRPYPKNRPDSLVPTGPDSYVPRVHLLDHDIALQKMRAASIVAAKYEPLRAAFSSYQRY